MKLGKVVVLALPAAAPSMVLFQFGGLVFGAEFRLGSHRPARRAARGWAVRLGASRRTRLGKVLLNK